MLERKKDMESKMVKLLLEGAKSLRWEVALQEEPDEVILWRVPLKRQGNEI